MGHSRSWGYGPSGSLGLVVIVLLVLVLERFSFALHIGPQTAGAKSRASACSPDANRSNRENLTLLDRPSRWPAAYVTARAPLDRSRERLMKRSLFVPLVLGVGIVIMIGFYPHWFHME